MKKILFLLIAAAFIWSCNSTSSAKIDAKVSGLFNKEVIIKVLNINTMNVIDTVKTDEDGVLRYRIKKITSTPEFYYLYYKNTRIASMILKAGDKVHLMTDTTGLNCKIDGSQESLLLTNLENELRVSLIKFDSLSKQYNVAIANNDKVISDSLNFALGKIYVKQKQSAIKHIFSNPYSLSNIILLYHSFPGDLPLFADLKDALIFNRVHDSLKVIYPDSRYLSILEKEGTQRLQSDALNYKFESSKVTVLPEINLPDIKAKLQSLNSLNGKVVLLSFWTATNVEQKMFNKELIEIYQKYSSKGLEIYQVSVDTDKTLWGRTVQDQGIPWISVCDGMGAGSSAVTTYNVQSLPTMYIINRSGDIVGKNIFSINALESKIKSLL